MENFRTDNNIYLDETNRLLQGREYYQELWYIASYPVHVTIKNDKSRLTVAVPSSRAHDVLPRVPNHWRYIMVYMFGLVGAHPSGNDQLLILIILELVHKQLQVSSSRLGSLYIVTCLPYCQFDEVRQLVESSVHPAISLFLLFMQAWMPRCSLILIQAELLISLVHGSKYISSNLVLSWIKDGNTMPLLLSSSMSHVNLFVGVIPFTPKNKKLFVGLLHRKQNTWTTEHT